MPIVKSHPAVPAPPHDDQKIWRFMPLEKLLSILLNGSIYFCQLQYLRNQDPYEGQYPEAQVDLQDKILREHLNYMRDGGGGVDSYDQGKLDSFKLLHSPETLKNIANILERHVYVNCWHINDHESAALWKLYCSNETGLAVTSTVGRLRKAVEGNERDIYIGRVEYIDFKTTPIKYDNIIHPIFNKRISFSHERELRLCIMEASEQKNVGFRSGDMNIMHRNPSGINISCDINKLISEIVVCPSGAPWFGDTVKAVVERLSPALSVRKSNLLESPQYEHKP